MIIKNLNYTASLAVLVLLLFTSCKQPGTLFTSINAASTGVDFQNTLPVNDTGFNILDYLYYFNGGGVATGDINNDGLPDLYFTSNLGADKLYLNKGSFKFEDITKKAGITPKSNWKTGVTMADVNGDGLLDIYVCAVGNFKQLSGKNELYINNGDLSFTESAAIYGIAVSALSTQATFFDFDKDGDLDMFLVCHSVHSVESYKKSGEQIQGDSLSGDRLFINEQKDGMVRFKEVTKEAGIYNSATGYGLNVIAGDFNNDNWDDIYVSNDFHENDYYYLNNRNGTFTETNKTAFGHESRFSMGSDVADMNNDGWLDIITMDMLPKDEKVLKSSASDDPLDIYQFKMSYGYHNQYSRNCLQLNTGGGRFFSEIGLYSGIEATDWSWAPLAADFNNDGIKDLFVTNGIVKRPNDLDYVKFTSNPEVFKALEKGKMMDKQAINKMPPGKIPNYIFEGQQSLQFIDRSAAWGFDEATLSNGAAYADLDNDGDLDIAINNINGPAMLYKNNTREKTKANYLNVKLSGAGLNKFGVGAKLYIKTGDSLQINYLATSRGFMSASTHLIHFGLGQHKFVDTLQVVWPTGKVQQLTHVAVNRVLVVNESAATPGVASIMPDSSASKHPLFEDVTAERGLYWKHEENDFNDFNVQSLIPHMVSTQGPKLAVADIDGDGLDDFFVCGARNQPSALFLQDHRGMFLPSQQELFEANAASEDVNALFFDANGDRHPDLYVACGGNEFSNNDTQSLDRLYINNGKGQFTKSTGLPAIPGNSSVATAADVDRDGDLDLFVGGRVVSNHYGEIPPSYLLLNDGSGGFSIAPSKNAPGLDKIGMVTDAAWADINADGWPDLVMVGEWMPVSVYVNNKGVLENQTITIGLDKTSGLWQSLQVADIDQNGYPDILAGNWGENSKLKASLEYPLQLYVGDPDNNGSADQLMAIAKQGQYYTFPNKEDLEKQLPSIIRKRYEGYSQMAGQTVSQVFADRLTKMQRLSVYTLSTSVLLNSGGSFKLQQMQGSMQWFPVFAWAIDDFTRDGKTDLLAAGNFYGVVPFEGRYDAGYGQLLQNSPKGWKALTPLESGLKLSGEVRSIKALKTIHGEQLYLVARNNEPLQVIRTVPETR